MRNVFLLLIVVLSWVLSGCGEGVSASKEDTQTIPFDLFEKKPIFQGIAINPLTLDYNPTGEVIFASIIKASDYFPDSLGQYYLYYAAHDSPGGISIAYSDSIDGPWVEHVRNPVVSNDWDPYYSVSHVSSPSVIWIAEKHQLYLYFHGENNTTRYAVSGNGIDFEYGGVAIENPETSTWTSSTSRSGYIGTNYIHDQNTDQGSKAVRYIPPIVEEGYYKLSMNWPGAGTDLASNVKIIVKSGLGTDIIYIDQRHNGGEWNFIGNFYFEEGSDGYVEISNDGADGYVIADAIKFQRDALVQPIIIDNTDDPVLFFNSEAGPSLASYARVFKYSIPDYNNNYIMTFMGELNGKLRIFLATSVDGEQWDVRANPIVSPVQSEGNNLSGPFFVQTGGKYYILYHSSTGKISYTEVGEMLDFEKHHGSLFEIDDVRVAAPFIYNSGEDYYMFVDYGTAGNTKIAYSIFR